MRSQRTVVIVHPGGLGDLLLAVPAVTSLTKRFPEHEVLLCGHGEGSQFLAECGVAHRSLSVQTTACTALFGGRMPDDPFLVDWLARCDCAVAWTSDESGMLSAALNRCGAIAAVAQSPFHSTLTGVHQSERYAEILGIPAEQVSIPHIALSQALKTEGRTYLSGCRPGRRPAVLVHPGSGSRHKCVKPETILPVLEGLEAAGLETLLLQGPADEEMIERLLLRLPRQPIVLRGLPLRLLAGVVSQIELFLGHDSGVTHLAALLGTPTVALFGPTAPARWAPRGPAVTVIKEKPCGCPDWDAVRRCHEKRCLDFSAFTILRACVTTRAAALTPRIS